MPQSSNRQEELERLRACVESPGWAMIVGRIYKLHTDKLKELTTDLDPAQTAKARGHLEALSTVLRLPEILQSELSGRKP